jgi:RHS repeat-associated protein
MVMDAQGSVREQFSSTGTLDGSVSYDANGNPIVSVSGMTTPLGYTGQWSDVASGLVYLRARWYDPVTAQFVSVDPAVSTTGQAYEYASGNPINLIDLTGNDSLFGWATEGFGVLSAITAFIPGAEGASEAFAIGALASDVGQCVTGGCNWTSLLLDAVAVIPGAAAVHFLSASEKARYGSEADRILERADGALKNDPAFEKALGKFLGYHSAALSGTSVASGEIIKSGQGSSSSNSKNACLP